MGLKVLLPPQQCLYAALRRGEDEPFTSMGSSQHCRCALEVEERIHATLGAGIHPGIHSSAFMCPSAARQGHHRHSSAPMLWAPEALSARKWKGGEAKALCLLSPFEGGCLLGRVFFPLPKKGCVLRKQKWTRGPKGLFGPHYTKHTWSRRRNRDAWRCDSGLVPALGQFCTAGLCALLPQCKLCRENQCSEGWSSSPMRKGWRNWVCLAWRREGCRETSLWPSRT